MNKVEQHRAAARSLEEDLRLFRERSKELRRIARAYSGITPGYQRMLDSIWGIEDAINREIEAQRGLAE